MFNFNPVVILIMQFSLIAAASAFAISEQVYSALFAVVLVPLVGMLPVYSVQEVRDNA